jgi:hypothetical protein
MAILAFVPLGAWMSILEDGACLVRVSSTIIYPAEARRGVRADQQVVRGGCEVWVQGEFVLLPLPIAIYD